MVANGRVLLVGLMATGKSTVGRGVAAALGWPYLDNDELVHQGEGLALEPLRQRAGVDGLRAAESQALTAALIAPPPVVAGVAAGVVLDPVDRARLGDSGAFVVWLRARPETLAARVGAGGDRPWLAPDPVEAFRRMDRERAPLFAEVASLQVEEDGRSAGECVQAVLSALPY